MTRYDATIGPARRVLRHLVGEGVQDRRRAAGDLQPAEDVLQVGAHGSLGRAKAPRELPAEAIAQIAGDVRNGRADQFGVQQVELLPQRRRRRLLPARRARRRSNPRHHAALGVDCGDVHQIDGVN
jgi:hypothetical protein